MDLKSMLNDSSSQRQAPRIHTPKSSFDRSSDRTSSYDSYPERQIFHPPPLPTSGSRSPATGSYFAAQSPSHASSSSISTPGANNHQIYAQSPGIHGPHYSVRENVPPNAQQYHGVSISPSPTTHQPPTPGALSQTNVIAHHHITTPTATFPRPLPTHDSIGSASESPHPNSRQISPHAQFQQQQQPSTPLGPPIAHARPSPQTHRPGSQGYESYRRASFGSVGSGQGREHNYNTPIQPEIQPRDQIQRQYSSGETLKREREQTGSVSPRTIPQSSPYRQMSLDSRSSRVIHNSKPQPSPVPPTPLTSEHSLLPNTPKRDTDRSVASSVESRGVLYTSPGESGSAQMASSVEAPSRGSVQTEAANPDVAQTEEPSLKRRSSFITGGLSPMQARKRRRRDEIPIFAHTSRKGKPLRIIQGSRAVPRTQAITQPTTIKRESPAVANGQPPVQEPPTALTSSKWEPSITNEQPYEDLTRCVCDWIFQTIGSAAPPSGGAMFEIEAKIGAIWDIEMDDRVQLPVCTETVLDTDRFRRTNFKSTMNMAQHRQLNEFLNDLVRHTFQMSQTSDRQMIAYEHTRECDEFFELTNEGRQHLPTSIQQWMNPRHTPRVRKTINLKDNSVKAQIIKSRIADLNVHSPREDFDYRLSISIESPWEGPAKFLLPMSEGGRDRNKDRMSYRHMAYQIDLTQVSHATKLEKEHELEVEISTEQVRRELANLQANLPSRYEEMVRGLLDNVRLLCRRGTIQR